MALLERVATLLRANLNDMIDRAEDPLKMRNQVVLDIENQLLQVKTQVAIALADLHLLQTKHTEHLKKKSDWMRKAETAMKRGDEELAREAVARSLASRDLARSFDEQSSHQRAQVENLKSALHRLETKLEEARTQSGAKHAAADGVEERFAQQEKQEEIDQLLAELKSKHSAF